MNKVKKTIGWADYSWNPVTGCLHQDNGRCAVKNCYAKRLAGRLRGRFGYDVKEPFKPTFHENRLGEPIAVKEPSRIFVSDMGDLFGEWVPSNWISKVLEIVKLCPQQTFLFLTKNPRRYLGFEFPDNCWIGATINVKRDVDTLMRNLALEDAIARVKFISFEPLYEEIQIDLSPFQWIIIGGQSNPDKPADFTAVKCLLTANIGLSLPVFMKDNIGAEWYPTARKEFPK